VRNFLRDHVEAGVFAPDAVRSLVAAFDGAWQSIKASGARLSDKQIELVRAAWREGKCATSSAIT
jgi:hypothetical protein